MRQVSWNRPAVEDLAKLEKGVARRIKQAVYRFAEGGSADIKKLHGIDPPVFRLRVGDYRVRFREDEEIIRIIRVLHRREAYR